MERYVCTTCGTQYPDSAEPPRRCTICEDERQYVGWNGQAWTMLAELQRSHRNLIKPQGHRITGIGTQPRFGIGQRALLMQTSAGNMLWDCISLIDDATAAEVTNLGGLSAIAISHPHFYSCMVEWSRRFGGIPIYLHAADQQWVMRRAPEIVFWDGETHRIFGNLTLIRGGGHFEGGTMLHWADGEDGAGSLLTGDIIQVVQDRRYVSFMRSFPNHIPLPASAVRHVVASVEPFAFTRLYGAWWDAIVQGNGKTSVERSAERYLRAIQG